MSYQTQIRAWLGGRGTSVNSPRIAVIGDSHVAALRRAQQFPARKEQYKHISIYRVLKDKDAKTVGDIDIPAFCREIRRFGPNDFVFSAIGGNQYAIVSTVKNRTEFDFLSSPTDDEIASDRAQLIPMRAITGYIESGVRGNDGPVLREIRNATQAEVFHLIPPPPKADNAFIVRHFETRFAGQGLHELGPTRPLLRLKCWHAQARALAEVCGELGITPIWPPEAGLTEDGFLKPACYAKDVTHANRRYGELVLKQVQERTGIAVNHAEGSA